MNKNLRLFARFFCIGLLTFGGGYSMLPMMQRELVEREKWATRDELLDYYAVAQCTPGIIAVNTATFVGAKVNRFFGALFATLGVVAPSLIIITAIAAVLEGFMDIKAVEYAFFGIRAAVGGLIVSSVYGIARESVKGWPAVVIASAVFAVSLFVKISPVIYALVAVALGIVIHLFKRRAEKKQSKHSQKEGGSDV